MELLYFLVSLLASVIGGICGIGGGVIIKPILDATGTMSVSSISFLSGCTVLSMSVISVLRNSSNKEITDVKTSTPPEVGAVTDGMFGKTVFDWLKSIISVLRNGSNNGIIDVKTSTPLAVGAVIGGVFGKTAFDLLKSVFQNENHLGAVQAALLIIVTLGALLYSIYSANIQTHHVENITACGLIGLVLGMISSFLGIGGGPINLTVLFFFFSMSTKKAAANSLYIIMFSQLASLVQSLLGGTIPDINILVLVLMVAAGVSGGIIGSHINKKISDKVVDKLFFGLMAVIIGINIYNFIKFLVFQ